MYRFENFDQEQTMNYLPRYQVWLTISTEQKLSTAKNERQVILQIIYAAFQGHLWN